MRKAAGFLIVLLLTTLAISSTAASVQGANDFSGDGSAVALWRVDNGALTTDSIGTNTLTDNNTVGTDTDDYQEGNASAGFEYDNSELFTIADANLDSGFPLKSGESNDDISVTFWYKKDINRPQAGLFTKWDTGAGARSFCLRDNSTKLEFYLGTNSGTGWELLNNSLSTSAGRWYHVGATFNNTTKAWKLRVWDDTAGSVVLDASGTATNNIAITSAAVAIGASLTSGTPERYFDGLIDEVVVFNDILTIGEIDKIRQGTYVDLCPGDPNKTEPGVCGCGISEWGAYCINNDDISHSAHLTAASGPPIASCNVCHVDSYAGLFSDEQNLENTTVCNTCHSPGGDYDGVDGSNIGAKGNWEFGVYDGSALRAGKEKWCVTCHDDDPSEVNGVKAPNIAGNGMDYGYYKTGHGKHGNEQGIPCLNCHDRTLTHVDGVARTYDSNANNYQAGYRLKLVDGVEPLDIPRPQAEPTEDTFRLCFSCHDSAPFLDINNPDTNFRADVNDSCDSLVTPANRHTLHLNIRSMTYDSDFKGVSPDSAPSCPACHNVHGPRLKDDATNAPAMIRTGELIGRESEGALNLEYFTGQCPEKTPSLTNELAGSTGGAMKFYDGSAGSVTKNGVCAMCHTETQPYWREAKKILSDTSRCGDCHGHDAGTLFDPDMSVPYTAGVTASPGRGTFQSHSTHTETDADDAKGPGIYCDTCHDITNFPFFNSGTDSNGDGKYSLSETDVCDTCHSPGGAYDGVDSDPETGSVGAKTNWDTGVYNGSALQVGKEKWCVTCHDGDPSVVNYVSAPAPNVAGNGVDYGYYKTGHGKHGNEQAITCLDCHDSTLMHVDGEPRTYDCGQEPKVCDPDVDYRTSYRLKLVDGEAPLDIPRAQAEPTEDTFRLCFSCHDSAPFLAPNNTNWDTNFRADVDDNCVSLDPPANRHTIHVRERVLRYDSDFNGVSPDSAISCPACHNVHGPRLKNDGYGGITHAPGMIRTGELIGRESKGALNLEYFTSNCPNELTSDTNELFDAAGNSTGGSMYHDPEEHQNPETRGGVCRMCHNTNEPYWREAKDILSVTLNCGNCHETP